VLLRPIPLLAAALAVAVTASGAQADPRVERALADARAVEKELVRVVQRVRGSAVTVVGRRARPSRTADGSGALLMGGVGSGVVISWRGTWVLTNYHVVDEEQSVEAVTADGRSHRLTLRATDRRSDLALLSFASVPQGVVAAPVERAARAGSKGGSWVVATGNPFFLALDGVGVATLGIVSGTRPPDPEAYLDVPTLQHDAEINPGSSGGALWSLRGELIGINGTIATRTDRRGGGPAHTGASFSVPVSAVRAFLTRTLGAAAGGPSPTVRSTPAPVTRRAGGLGVSFRTTTDRAGRPAGALVSRIASGSPAAPSPGRSGLQAGDLVTTFSAAGRNYRIRSAADVENAMRLYPAGTPVSLRFYRAGRALAWSGRLTAR